MNLRISAFAAKFFWVAFCFAGSMGVVLSTEAVSEIFGYNQVDCPGGSDTVVGVSFHRPASYAGAISGSPAIQGGEATVTVAGTPQFGANEFTAEPHYLRFTGDGTRSGWVYPVNGHDPTTITIDLRGDDLSGVSGGNTFELIPHWTLGTLFPKDSQTTIHLSTGNLPPGRKSQVLFFDETGTGIGLAPDRVYYLTTGGWFLSDEGFPAADDVVIPPGKIFVIRHPAGGAATAFLPHQVVEAGKHSAPLRTHSDDTVDNAVGLMRPVPVKLSDLDLGATFLESASTDSGDRKDELLVYDNLQAAINKHPSTTYFRTGGAWRKDNGATYPIADTDEISPSHGVVIRKSATPGGETLRWLNLPRY